MTLTILLGGRAQENRGQHLHGAQARLGEERLAPHHTQGQAEGDIPHRAGLRRDGSQHCGAPQVPGGQCRVGREINLLFNLPF